MMDNYIKAAIADHTAQAIAQLEALDIEEKQRDLLKDVLVVFCTESSDERSILIGMGVLCVDRGPLPRDILGQFVCSYVW